MSDAGAGGGGGEPSEEEEPDALESATQDMEDTSAAIDEAGAGAAEAVEGAFDKPADAAAAATGVVASAVHAPAAVVQGAVAGVAKVLNAFDRFGVTTSSFIFAIDGRPIGAFQSLTGMSVELDVYEIEEGGNNHSTVKRPGRMQWSDLTLRRGIATLDTLWDWINKASGEGFSAEDTAMDRIRTLGLSKMAGKNRFDAQTGALILTDRFGIPLRSWWVYEALPKSWTGPDFSAESSADGVPMEELVITHEGLKRMDLL